MKRCTDPTFVYKPSHATDVAATIRRERKRLKALQDAQAKEQAENAAEAVAKTVHLKRTA